MLQYKIAVSKAFAAIFQLRFTSVAGRCFTVHFAIWFCIYTRTKTASEKTKWATIYTTPFVFITLWLPRRRIIPRSSTSSDCKRPIRRSTCSKPGEFSFEDNLFFVSKSILISLRLEIDYKTINSFIILSTNYNFTDYIIIIQIIIRLDLKIVYSYDELL